ncbi:hypothetical protein PMI21_03042 [Pseudomonas sp. GM18]|uniref:hypothetical protein n=1 Tax=Pseudomonas sp. GM18 TaxID=1144324 RepID=UPI0002722A95|nr:hypothetical protein [Pseudomonas sp. GM18]EJM16115.1 hypothetical protein PMI21_03042 [Pseudomonas sp. GM18]
MSQQKQTGPKAVVIGKVREATFDPQIGESVWLEVEVLASDTRSAASDIAVFFTAEPGPETVRVKTDGNGKARFAYTATQAGNVEVIATLEGIDSKTASHTFRFKALKAGVWDAARIQLNADESITPWGEKTLFPRTPQAHTIKLSVEAGSPLLGRNICLGLTGDSSPSELGITSVQPALGVNRTLTADGLSWVITGTIGGAYNLRLEASRILKQSPDNPMSLGPALEPSDELPVYRVRGQECETVGIETVVKIPLGSRVEFSISVPPKCLNETVLFQLLGERGMDFSPGLNVPHTFSELTKVWTVMASIWGLEEYIYQLTYSASPNFQHLLKFVIED